MFLRYNEKVRRTAIIWKRGVLLVKYQPFVVPTSPATVSGDFWASRDTWITYEGGEKDGYRFCDHARIRQRGLAHMACLYLCFLKSRLAASGDLLCRLQARTMK